MLKCIKRCLLWIETCAMINTFSNVEKSASFVKRAVPAFLILAVASWLLILHRISGTALCVCAVVSGALLVPYTGKKIFFLLSLFAASVGFLLLNTLTILFYYCIFTPLALMLRLFKKNQISLKNDPEATTAWQDHAPVEELKQYMKQY